MVKALYIIPLLFLLPLQSMALIQENPSNPSIKSLTNSMNILSSTYYTRPDLQTAYPEVKQGNYINLIQWAINEPSNDSNYVLLHPNLSNYIYLSNNISLIIDYPISFRDMQDISIPLGHEGLWFFNQNQMFHFRCWSYANLGNYTLDSIEGTISYAKINETKNSFEQAMTVIFLSKYNYNSPDTNNTSTQTTSSDCKTQFGTTASYTDLFNDNTAIWIGEHNLKLGSGQNSTDVYYSVHPNITIPPKYYLVFITDEGGTNGNVGFDDLEPQLVAHIR